MRKLKSRTPKLELAKESFLEFEQNVTKHRLFCSLKYTGDLSDNTFEEAKKKKKSKQVNKKQIKVSNK